MIMSIDAGYSVIVQYVIENPIKSCILSRCFYYVITLARDEPRTMQPDDMYKYGTAQVPTVHPRAKKKEFDGLISSLTKNHSIR